MGEVCVYLSRPRRGERATFVEEEEISNISFLPYSLARRERRVFITDYLSLSRRMLLLLLSRRRSLLLLSSFPLYGGKEKERKSDAEEGGGLL